jgi:hypothetical protein
VAGADSSSTWSPHQFTTNSVGSVGDNQKGEILLGGTTSSDSNGHREDDGDLLGWWAITGPLKSGCTRWEKGMKNWVVWEKGMGQKKGCWAAWKKRKEKEKEERCGWWGDLAQEALVFLKSLFFFPGSIKILNQFEFEWILLESKTKALNNTE